MSIEWVDDYCLGISEIDIQHKELFSILADIFHRYGSLSDDALQGKNKLQFFPYIWKLRKHAFYHFITEEEFMVRYRYPEYFDHKNMHNDLMREIFNLEDRLINSEDALQKDQILLFFDALVRHVTKADRKFGGFLRDPGVLTKMLTSQK